MEAIFQRRENNKEALGRCYSRTLIHYKRVRQPLETGEFTQGVEACARALKGGWWLVSIG